MKTGNTRPAGRQHGHGLVASMEPGHEDREYVGGAPAAPALHEASMEPGHEDREYAGAGNETDIIWVPQWSPVMKTGNTP